MSVPRLTPRATTNATPKSLTALTRGVVLQPVNLAEAYAEGRRLTERDRWLIDLLAEHRVLTAEHVNALAFDHIKRARRRLLLLCQRGVLARFRRHVPVGSQSWRYTLGVLGEAIHAAAAGDPLPRPAKIAEKITRLAESRDLEHRLGVNGFFVALAAQARTQPGCELADWWSEHRTAETTGQWVRPDGFGVWTEPAPDHSRTGPAVAGTREIRFFLEYDRGSESLATVLAKLDSYAELTRARVRRPVLFVFTTTARQAHFTARAAAAGWPRDLTVATTATDQHHSRGPIATSGPSTLSPADRVWLPLGSTTRRRLIELDQIATTANPPRPRRHPAA